MRPKLALPRCDQCGSKWHAKYRKKRSPIFFCPKCRRRHPRWTAKDIAIINREAELLLKNMKHV